MGKIGKGCVVIIYKHKTSTGAVGSCEGQC